MKSTDSSRFLIRKARYEELEMILATQVQAFTIYTNLFSAEQIPPLNESIEQIQHDLEHKTILVACKENRVVGSVRYDINLGVCHFELLSVHPDYQKQSIGQQLVVEIESLVAQQAHKICLETGLLASDLISFYSRLGYSGEAILKQHYGQFDWIVFSKFL